MKANLFPPSMRILVDQYQSRGLLSGGKILPSNWKFPLDTDPTPPSSEITSKVESDSLEAKVRTRRKHAKCAKKNFIVKYKEIFITFPMGLRKIWWFRQKEKTSNWNEQRPWRNQGKEYIYLTSVVLAAGSATVGNISGQ